MLGLSLFSMGTRFRDVVMAMMREQSGVMTKSATCRWLKDHCRMTLPPGVCKNQPVDDAESCR